MTTEIAHISIIILGYWNLAILNPNGVAKRIFRVDEGTPVDVEVALDGLRPMRIRHDGATVSPGPRRLQILADTPTIKCIEQLTRLAGNCIASLPETPVEAIGINCHFRASDDSRRAVTAAISTELDNQIAKHDIRLKGRIHQWSTSFGDGFANVSILDPIDGDCEIRLNLEQKSTDKQKLLAWIEQPNDQFKEKIKHLIEEVLQINDATEFAS